MPASNFTITPRSQCPDLYTYRYVVQTLKHASSVHWFDALSTHDAALAQSMAAFYKKDHDIVRIVDNDA